MNAHPVIAVACLLAAPAAIADVFVLENGGRVRGQWLNRTERPATYIVQTASGARVTIDRSQVRETIRESPALAEYEVRAPAAADTIPGQWQLAEWCRENKLTPERAVHLRRILELNPDHVEARHGLGYSQIRGQWVLKEEFLRKEGLELYQGRWLTTQEIALAEGRKRASAAESDWLEKLKRWRSELGTAKGAAAQENIASVRDPLAIRPLASLLRTEPAFAVKTLYIDTLAAIPDNSARVVLVSISLGDPDVEIFHACLERIAKRPTEDLIEFYVRMLKDNNNVRVNRAAIALARFGDRSAIPALIDALVSTHTTVVSGGRADALTTTFARPAGAAPGNDASGMSLGGGGPKVFQQQVPNQEVLNALVKLSGGVSHGFNQPAWHAWYELKKDQPRLR